MQKVDTTCTCHPDGQLATANYGDGGRAGRPLPAALSAFGESLHETDRSTSTPSTYISFFTGKPYVEGLGHAFLMRNYCASLGKWQTADPLGYPDGWNALAYCGNGVTSAVDLWGAKKKPLGPLTADKTTQCILHFLVNTTGSNG